MKNKKLSETIDNISIQLGFISCDYTVKQKVLMCQAFKSILDSFPSEMSSYLTMGKRGASIQNKIFKEYIKLLEHSLPLIFTKCGKKYIINDLLDKNLNVFSSKEEFEQTVNEKLKIKNNTKKMYIGGRKASYVAPYYIGKLIDVIDIDSGTSLLSKVDDYTFSYIKMSGVKPGTKVKVIHLGVPPHYQMGAMSYLNRIKTQIKKSL